MVFIQIPTQLTEEELTLKRKYQKLKRKKKALQQLNAPKVEAPPIQPTIKRSSESGTDAKEVAKKLLKSGKIHAIKAPDSRERQESGFKRSKALERKRGIGSDKPGGYQPFSMSHSFDSDDSAMPSAVDDLTSPSKAACVKPLYESFVSSRDPEAIAREETFKEKRRDGKANYVNRDTPMQGNTIYVHGFGLSETFLRTNFATFGNIVNLTSESEKNCGFVTYDSINCANKAIDDMNGKTLSGIKLKVSFARRQPMIVERNNAQTESTNSGHSSTTEVWSSIAASYSQKGAVKDKRNLISYEEADMFASLGE